MLRGVACAVLAALSIGCGGTDAPDGGVEPRGARAADFRSPRVEAAVEAASRVVRMRGFAPEGEPWRGFLVEQATDVREAPMRSGSCYVVLGVGSSALREIDLRLFDGEGAEVARDLERGAIAVVRFCPVVSGTYHCAVRASAGSGLFEVREFRGPTGLAFRVEDVIGTLASDPASAGGER